MLTKLIPVSLYLLALAASGAASERRRECMIDLDHTPIPLPSLADGWVTFAKAALSGDVLKTEGPDAGICLREPIKLPRFWLKYRLKIADAARGRTTSLSLILCGPPSSATPQFKQQSCYCVHLTTGLRPTATLTEYPEGSVLASNAGVGVGTDREHVVTCFRHGQRMIVFLDDRPILDARDYDPLPPGHAAVATNASKLQVTSVQLSKHDCAHWRYIDKLKDLHLSTNLAQAAIVTSGQGSPQARRLSAGLKERLGLSLPVVRDLEANEALLQSKHLISLGNLANNRLIERLYCECYTFVDRLWPGKGGCLVQTIHNPYGHGKNVIVLGASDAVGMAECVDRFLEHATSREIGRIYEVRLGPEHEYPDELAKGSRVIFQLPWRMEFTLKDRDYYGGILYLMTGRRKWAVVYREATLAKMEKGTLHHLYVFPRMLLWDLMEEHDVFTDAERLQITNWLLRQMRSSESVGMLHIRNTWDGRPLQNHGSRPGLSSLFGARYFKHGYRLPEADEWLARLQYYFTIATRGSKPMCDSSGHQWQATLENIANYSLARHDHRFLYSGLARTACRRALVGTNNCGSMAIIGDAQWTATANSLLAKCAYFHADPTLMWLPTVREQHVMTNDGYPRAATDEPGRAFADGRVPLPPVDHVGVKVAAYDRYWGTRWEHMRIPKPNVPPHLTFDKLSMRPGLEADDDYLLLDGMMGGSHDYDDTNTIHEYSRGGRVYLASLDSLFGPTMAHHNGVTIVRGGLSQRPPSTAELIHADHLGPVLVSQTRLNEYACADWTRTIILRPRRYFVTIDEVRTRDPGEFAATLRWRAFGEPTFSDGALRVGQWPENGRRDPNSHTYFHVQPVGGTSTHKRAPRNIALNGRYYRYAQTTPPEQYGVPQFNILSSSTSRRLAAGESLWFATLCHVSGSTAQAQFHLEEIEPGLYRVTGQEPSLLAARPFEFRSIRVDARLTWMGDGQIAAAGCRRINANDTRVFAADAAENIAIRLETGHSVHPRPIRPAGQPLSALDRAVATAALAATPSPVATLTQVRTDSLPRLVERWRFCSGDRASHLWTRDIPASIGVAAMALHNGKGVVFIDANGKPSRRIDVGSPVNVVAVADVEGDGEPELLVGRHDAVLECRSLDGAEKWHYRFEKQRSVNSRLNRGRASVESIFPLDLDGCGNRTIVCGLGDQHVHGLDPTGKRLWGFWSYAGIFTICDVIDLDGDGILEPVGGNRHLASVSYAYIVDVKAQSARRHKKRIMNDGWTSTLSALRVADLTGDGKAEFICGTSRGNIYVHNPRADEPDILWQRHLGEEVSEIVIPHVEGSPLVVAASESSFVTAFDGAGQLRWATPLPAAVYTMALTKREGKCLVAVGCANGQIVLLDLGGRPTATCDITASPRMIQATDIDGDGTEELIVLAEGSTLVALGQYR